LVCEAVNLQPGSVFSPTPPAAVDGSVAVVGSSTTPAVAWVLQATGIGESFKAKPPDPAASEVCPKRDAFVCSRRSARLAAKCRGGTFKYPDTHRCLRRKVVLRRRLSRPRSCSGCPRRGVAPLVAATLLLLLHVASACLAGSSGWLRARMWMLLMVALDVASSRTCSPALLAKQVNLMFKERI
jgi:hypothetical protein